MAEKINLGKNQFLLQWLVHAIIGEFFQHRYCWVPWHTYYLPSELITKMIRECIHVLIFHGKVLQMAGRQKRNSEKML
jgi:hypothetical protein